METCAPLHRVIDPGKFTSTQAYKTSVKETIDEFVGKDEWDANIVLRPNGGTHPEKTFNNWLQKQLLSMDFTGMTVNSDKEIQKCKTLASYFVAKKKRPDSSVLIRDFPCAILEMVSDNNIEKTSGELLAHLLDQLRLFRSYDPDKDYKLKGWIVPPLTSAYPTVSITFWWDCEGYVFDTKLKYGIGRDELVTDIQSQLKEVCTYIRTTFQEPMQHKFFLPLSRRTLLTFGDNAIQLHSGKSIVVATKEKVHKLIVSPKVFTQYTEFLAALTIKGLLSKHMCLLRKPENSLFLESPRLMYPFEPSEVVCCLADFAEICTVALESIHAIGVAHLDVRLDNICFQYEKGNNIIAVLIDFDNSRFVKAQKFQGSGRMFESIEEWTNANLDWRQLGIILAWIVDSRSVTHEDCHDLNESSPFASHLSLHWAFGAMLFASIHSSLKKCHQGCIHNLELSLGQAQCVTLTLKGGEAYYAACH